MASQHVQYSRPSPKRRRVGEDGDFFAGSSVSVAASPNCLHAPPLLAIEPCSIKRLEDHVSFLQSEIEEYQDLINMKKAEISHAELRIEYLKSTPVPTCRAHTGNGLITVSKEHLVKTITDAIMSKFGSQGLNGRSSIHQSALEEINDDIVRMIESSDYENGETQHNDDEEIDNCDGDNTNGFDSDNNEEATSTMPSKSKASDEKVMTNPRAKGNTKDGYTGTYMRHVLQKKVRRGYVPTHVEIDALVDVVNVIDFFKAKKKDGLLRGTAKGYKSTISSFYLSHFPNAGKNWDDAANTWNPAFHPTVVDIVNSLPIKKEKG